MARRAPAEPRVWGMPVPAYPGESHAHMKSARFGAPASEKPELIDAEGELPDLATHFPDLKSDPDFSADGRSQAQLIVAWEKRLKTLFL